jgi:hypothetical protein
VVPELVCQRNEKNREGFPVELQNRIQISVVPPKSDSSLLYKFENDFDPVKFQKILFSKLEIF